MTTYHTVFISTGLLAASFSTRSYKSPQRAEAEARALDRKMRALRFAPTSYMVGVSAHSNKQFPAHGQRTPVSLDTEKHKEKAP